MEGYLRYPHVHDDLIAFVAADDVWLAPVTGGRGWRLSDERVPARYPRFSPDGRYLAWSALQDGNFEVMLAEVETGAIRRLTWLGARTLVLGWAADDKVLISSAAGQHTTSRTLARTVDLDGQLQELGFGPASGLAIHPNGTWALSSALHRMPEAWKRYRGGTAAKLWVRHTGAAWQRLLSDDTAALVHPMWVGDTLVVASDREGDPREFTGQANLWALPDLATRSGGDAELLAPQRITQHTTEQGYVRDPATDGARIIYHSRGTLYLLEQLDAAPRPLTINLPGRPAAQRHRMLNPHKNLDSVSVDHTGDASLIGWRGNAVRVTHREGPARVIAADSAVRLREPELLGRSGFAAIVSDRHGADHIEIHSLDGSKPVRELATADLGRVLHLAVTPDGRRLAAIIHDGRVLLIDVADGATQQVARSRNGEALSPCFSPDGRYLVWSEPTGNEDPHRLVAVDVSGESPSEPIALTGGRFHDFSPAFSSDGKYLMFLSARTFDPVYDETRFDLGFTATVRPYLVPLAAAEPPPFGPSVEGWRFATEDDDPPADKPAEQPGSKLADTAASRTSTSPAETGETASADSSSISQPVSSESATPETPQGPTLDADGFEERLVAFPVPAGHYQQLAAAKDGVLWLRGEPSGVLGSRYAGAGSAPSEVIEYFSFPNRSASVVADPATGFAVSGDGTRMVVWHKGSLSAQPTTKHVDGDDPERIEIDLDRVRVNLDPVAEWHQMFDENARLMSQNFWRADLGGADWDAVQSWYRPLVARLGGSDDLVDLLWEVNGELNTSHAYAGEPPGTRESYLRLGLLGADLQRTQDGWAITRILPGESSDPEARSPLRAAGVDARVGDVIVEVNGQAVPEARGPNALLVGTADQPVELTLRRTTQAVTGDAVEQERETSNRRVVVVPLADDTPLRYQAWVADRRDYTHRLSGGRLGYVHVPDMMGAGWAQLSRDMRRETRYEGLIVDVRDNRGGHTSQLVIERLTRRIVGWDLPRHADEAVGYPESAPRGPVVLVADRFAGSDGDIVNAAAQELGLGPVVGERTWGGVVGIDMRFDLVDGTQVTQPKYAFWFPTRGWSVENHGVDPDIEVIAGPNDETSDADPQLDRAIEEALTRLETQPAVLPPRSPDQSGE